MLLWPHPLTGLEEDSVVFDSCVLKTLQREVTWGSLEQNCTQSTPSRSMKIQELCNVLGTAVF